MLMHRFTTTVVPPQCHYSHKTYTNVRSMLAHRFTTARALCLLYPHYRISLVE